MTQQSTMIEWVNPASLKEHPLNHAIYGDEPIDDLIASIQDLGIIQPLHVKRDNVVISGHRRFKAAKAIGLPNVPVIHVSYADELEERQALLEFNRYRHKTGSQLYAEGLEHENVEAELAKRRQVASHPTPGQQGFQKVHVEEIFPQHEPQNGWDKPATSKYESMSDAQLAEEQERLEAHRIPSKTGEQLYAEGKEYEAQDAERAKRRQESGWDKLNEQEAERVRQVKALQAQEKARESQTRDKVAASLGIGSGKQWDKLKLIGEQAKAGNAKAAELLPQINNGMTITTAVKKLKDIEKQEFQEAEANARHAIRAITTASCRLAHGDFRELSATIPDGSVDVIITDPPYDESVIELCRRLGEVAQRILKPGGSLISMVGQYRLPNVMAELSKSLQYHWTLAYLTPGGQSPQIWPRKVNTFWKPLLWYTKGEYTGSWHGDVIKSDVNDNDKRFHQWGQSESGMARIVDAFSEPGETILDPFMGAGTTGLVALDAGRDFIGFEINEISFKTAKGRMASYA